MNWNLEIYNGVPSLRCCGEDEAFVWLVQAHVNSSTWSVWRHYNKHQWAVDWCDTLQEAIERGEYFLGPENKIGRIFFVDDQSLIEEPSK